MDEDNQSETFLPHPGENLETCSQPISDKEPVCGDASSGLLPTHHVNPIATDTKSCLEVVVSVEGGIPTNPTIPCPVSCVSLQLSDSVSVIPEKEILERREGLRLFSSQLSMASSLSRSTNLVAGVGMNYEMTPFSSTLSSLYPMCRICQCPAEPDNTLITPCRCDGSLKHIHATCLLVSTSFTMLT